MKHILYVIIANCGDGSNTLEYCTDPTIVELKREMAEQGSDRYASGDGLQVHEFEFRTQEALDSFVKDNVAFGLDTLENRNEWDENFPSSEDDDIYGDFDIYE